MQKFVMKSVFLFWSHSHSARKSWLYRKNSDEDECRVSPNTYNFDFHKVFLCWFFGFFVCLFGIHQHCIPPLRGILKKLQHIMSLNQKWLENIMEFSTTHLRNVFIRALLKTDFGEELGEPSYFVERDRRAVNSTAGSLILLSQWRHICHSKTN